MWDFQIYSKDRRIYWFSRKKSKYYTGYDPKLYRPDGVNFTLNKSPSLYYKYPIKLFDVIYLVNGTGLMSGSIEKVKTYCGQIANILKNQMMPYDFKLGLFFIEILLIRIVIKTNITISYLILKAFKILLKVR